MSGLAGNRQKGYQLLTDSPKCHCISFVSVALFRSLICVELQTLGRWGATAAPILAYLGEESSLDDDLGGTGWLTDNAR
ncbi:hypothetical protein WN944_018615 [Citrus x changshan-huyou]|uniref:Uncharacterized protein n=1 Tax=Citrus x changshan-huyou TaxID=2935761 RepID=A0AAP0LTS0_9ROSI